MLPGAGDKLCGRAFAAPAAARGSVVCPRCCPAPREGAAPGEGKAEQGRQLCAQPGALGVAAGRTREGGGVALHRVPVLVQQELLKVPGHLLAGAVPCRGVRRRSCNARANGIRSGGGGGGPRARACRPSCSASPSPPCGPALPLPLPDSRTDHARRAASPCIAGVCCLSQANTGCASGPLTSTLDMSGNWVRKREATKASISAALPGSCPPNCG